MNAQDSGVRTRAARESGPSLQSTENALLRNCAHENQKHAFPCVLLHNPAPVFAFQPLTVRGCFDSLLAAQHVLEMFRPALPDDASRRRLNRLSNRLTKILSEARKLATP